MTLSIILLFMLVFTFFFLSVLVAHKNLNKMQYIAVICVALTFYLLGYLLEINAPTAEAAGTALLVANLGIPALPIFSLLVVIQICDYKFLRRWMGIAAALHSFLLFCLIFFNQYHKLYYTYVSITHAQWTQVSTGHGPFYIYNQLVATLCVLASYVLLGKRFSDWGPRMRRLMAFVAIGSALAFIANILNVLGVFSNRLDLTPFAYFITLLFYFLAIYYNRIYDLVPLATERAISTMDNGFIILDQDGNYLYANQSARTLFPDFDTTPVCTSIADVKNWPLTDTIEPGKYTFTLPSDTGEKVYRASVSVVSDGSNTLGWSIVIRDNTETVHLMQSLEHLALTDSLTGIYNRRHFEELAQREIALAQRSLAPLSIIMFDLDHFKRVNDTYGHLAGDKVLASISHAVLARLRPGDIFARYGGEEFIILAPNTNKKGAIAFANRLRQLVADTPVTYQENVIMMKASFGVTEWEQGNDLHAAISAADNDMYAAKTAGRNRVKFIASSATQN